MVETYGKARKIENKNEICYWLMVNLTGIGNRLRTMAKDTVQEK